MTKKQTQPNHPIITRKHYSITYSQTWSNSDKLAEEHMRHIATVYMPVLPYNETITFVQFADRIAKVYSMDNIRNRAACEFLRAQKQS